MAMARTNADDALPVDLLPILRQSGIVPDRVYQEIQAKVREGEYPKGPKELAQKLIKERVITEFQAKRLLRNRADELVIGRYIIVDRLGSGSMGHVYKAQHPLMGRIVALKKIAPEIVTNDRVVARFQREMRLMGKLDHPNVVRAFDADADVGKNLLYIVMEYVQGKSLAEILRAQGPLKPAEVVDYGMQTALGLSHAHAQGIVHRDIKPSNLLLNEDKQIKILDLGLGVLLEADDQSSFATADGIAVGTIDFMSPEQACGKEVDGRSDLFSLGCSMYNLMTGKLPFPGESPIERLGKRIRGKPYPLGELRTDLPSSLVQVMDKLMATKPHERFQTAAEAADALGQLIRRKSKSPVSPGTPIFTNDPDGSPVSSGITRSPSSSGTAPSPVADKAMRPPVPPPPPVILRPDYPAWFRPLAAMVEASGFGAILVFLTVLLLTFAAGFLTSMMRFGS